MISRRTLLARSAGLAAGLAAARVDAAPVLTDDGLYSEPWFLESFLILAEDLEAAAARGKRFAVIWELKGCPFCRDTHLVNFADPTVAGFIKDRFEILQLNIIGGREVVDLTASGYRRRAWPRGTGSAARRPSSSSPTPAPASKAAPRSSARCSGCKATCSRRTSGPCSPSSPTRPTSAARCATTSRLKDSRALLVHRRILVHQQRDEVRDLLGRQHLVGAKARHVRAGEARLRVVDLLVGRLHRLGREVAQLAVADERGAERSE